MIDIPFKIRFKDMPGDEGLIRIIRRRIARLERISHHMITGSAYVEKSQKLSRPGGVYTIRLEVFIPPRKELVVRKRSRANSVFPKLTPLITAAFEAAERELLKEKTKNSGSHQGHRAGKTHTAAGTI